MQRSIYIIMTFQWLIHIYQLTIPKISILFSSKFRFNFRYGNWFFSLKTYFLILWKLVTYLNWRTFLNLWMNKKNCFSPISSIFEVNFRYGKSIFGSQIYVALIISRVFQDFENPLLDFQLLFFGLGATTGRLKLKSAQ